MNKWPITSRPCTYKPYLNSLQLLKCYYINLHEEPNTLQTENLFNEWEQNLAQIVPKCYRIWIEIYLLYRVWGEGIAGEQPDRSSCSFRELDCVLPEQDIRTHSPHPTICNRGIYFLSRLSLLIRLCDLGSEPKAHTHSSRREAVAIPAFVLLPDDL